MALCNVMIWKGVHAWLIWLIKRTKQQPFILLNKKIVYCLVFKQTEAGDAQKQPHTFLYSC